LGKELGLNMRGVLTKPIRLETFRITLAENAAPSPARMTDELREAIESGQLALHYQPIVSLPSRSIVAVEALVRWNHPVRGLVPPDLFVPFAETHGLIDALTDFVLREAIGQAAAWAAQSYRLSISINL